VFVNEKKTENQRSVMENKYIAIIELFFLVGEVVVHYLGESVIVVVMDIPTRTYLAIGLHWMIS